MQPRFCSPLEKRALEAKDIFVILALFIKYLYIIMYIFRLIYKYVFVYNVYKPTLDENS